MPAPVEGPPWLVVDHELLSRLGPTSSRAEWERTLKRTGLWDLQELEGEPGKHLAEVRSALRGWPEEQAPDETVEMGWALMAMLGLAAVAALVTFAAVYGGGFFFFLGIFPAIGAWGGFRRLRRAAPRPALTDSGHATYASNALRRFLSYSFVTAAGDRVVENTPHRAYLELRLEEVDRALRLADARLAELREVRTRIAATNARMGRPVEDIETERLGVAILEQEAARTRVEGVRALLARRLAELDAQLDRLRVVVERQALSERVSRLTEPGARQDPVERVAADVEVDVAEIEGRVRELALEAGDADARLRAVLEVVRAGAR